MEGGLAGRLLTISRNQWLAALWACAPTIQPQWHVGDELKLSFAKPERDGESPNGSFSHTVDMHQYSRHRQGDVD